MSVEVWMSAFRASGGIPFGPADLRDLMALAISVLLGGLILISRSWVGGGMSGGAGGGGGGSVECFLEVFCPPCSLFFLTWDGVSVLVLDEAAGVVVFSPTVPWLSRTVSSCFVGLLRLPRWSAPQCGFFLSFLALLFTCLFFSQY